MEKKIFVIDVTRCVACYNCFIACKDEFVDHTWLPYSDAQPDNGPSFITVEEVERGQFPKVKVSYIPKPCVQCESAPCIRAGKNGAVYRRDDGIVIIDPQKSKGQKQIVEACPYGSIIWNEELNIPQKCTCCAHLLDQGWKEPRCVEACPTQALRFGEMSEFADVLDNTEQLHPEYKRNPSARYIGLPKIFVAGSVYSSDSGECLEGVRVTLTSQDSEITTAVTDNYGDFEFEGLGKGVKHLLKIEADGYHPVTIKDLLTHKDVYVGDISLQKK